MSPLAKQIYKSRVKQGLTIDKDLFNTLNKLSEESRIPKSKLVDEALELLFKQHNIEVIKEYE